MDAEDSDTEYDEDADLYDMPSKRRNKLSRKVKRDETRASKMIITSSVNLRMINPNPRFREKLEEPLNLPKNSEQIRQAPLDSKSNETLKYPPIFLFDVITDNINGCNPDKIAYPKGMGVGGLRDIAKKQNLKINVIPTKSGKALRTLSTDADVFKHNKSNFVRICNGKYKGVLTQFRLMYGAVPKEYKPITRYFMQQYENEFSQQ